MADILTKKASYDETVNSDEKESEQLDLAASEVEYKRLLRKLDLHLLPFVSLLYLLSFL